MRPGFGAAAGSGLETAFDSDPRRDLQHDGGATAPQRDRYGPRTLSDGGKRGRGEARPNLARLAPALLLTPSHRQSWRWLGQGRIGRSRDAPRHRHGRPRWSQAHERRKWTVPGEMEGSPRTVRRCERRHRPLLGPKEAPVVPRASPVAPDDATLIQWHSKASHLTSCSGFGLCRGASCAGAGFAFDRTR